MTTDHKKRLAELAKGLDAELGDPCFCLLPPLGEKCLSCLGKESAQYLRLTIKLTKALEMLSKLGNGERPGNSTGNMIARTALSEFDSLDEG